MTGAFDFGTSDARSLETMFEYRKAQLWASKVRIFNESTGKVVRHL